MDLKMKTKQNIKQGLKKRVWNPEWGKLSGQARVGSKRNTKSGNEHGNYGKPKSSEHKQNLSLARTGEKHSKEWNQAIKNNRQKCIEVKSKPIVQLDKNNNVLNEYKSITEAKNKTGIKGIPNALIGVSKTAGGFIWRYKIN